MTVASTSSDVNVSLTARCERDGDISQNSRRQRQEHVVVSPPQSCQHHVTGRIPELLNNLLQTITPCVHLYDIFTYVLPLIIFSRLCASSPALKNRINWDRCHIYAPLWMKDTARRLSVRARVVADSVQSLRQNDIRKASVILCH